MIINPYAFGGASIAEAVSIHANLVSWWDFEENSAGTQFLDSHSTHHLDIINSETSSGRSTASGKHSRAASWPVPNSSSGCQIPRSDSAFDFGDQDFCIFGWVYVSTNIAGGTSRWIAGRLGGTGAGQQSFNLMQDGVTSFNRLIFSVRNSADTADTNTGTAGASLWAFLNEWVFVAAWHDSVANEIAISFNGSGSPATAAHTGGVYNAGTANFSFGQGRRSDTTNWTTTRTWSHRTDSWGVMTKVPTDDELTYLYNSGNGKSYSELVADT